MPTDDPLAGDEEELRSSTTDFDGVEAEDDDVDGDNETLETSIQEPFNPTKIRIRTWSPTIDLLMTRVRENEIDLMPDFQRAAGIWSIGAQSRLIESVLIRIPLPAFYMDATNEEHLLVVDGLQRLTTLRRFIVDNNLRLKGLEFLHDLTGSTFSELPRHFQRRIQETQVTVYLIEKGTPEKVKYNIFKRINTGGLPLSPQEIRHALNPGPVCSFLMQLAQHQSFLTATAHGVSPKRMVDRECVLRFAAFAITPFGDYKTADFDYFLHATMEAINAMSDGERAKLSSRFVRAMKAASAIFGNYAFRKRYTADDIRRPVNKTLFEAWSVNLDALDAIALSRAIEMKDVVQQAFLTLMSTDAEFEKSVTYGTTDPAKVKVRFRKINELLKGVLA